MKTHILIQESTYLNLDTSLLLEEKEFHFLASVGIELF